jgi:O-antigen/teichoic acid export membrane protein
MRLLFTSRFSEAGQLARFLAFGAVAHGLGDLFNRFLGAHGRGRNLRNAAFLEGVVNVSGYLVLVGLIGTWGAAITAVLAGVGYLTCMVYYYVLFVGKKGASAAAGVE